MENAKIWLSEKELDLMRNSAWILTKNAVIAKLSEGLGDLAGWMQRLLHEKAYMLPSGLTGYTPKISRGEKYMGLPYLMLDYPRLFERENILAIRTFFWWGNFCSVTLHAKGQYQQLVLDNCLQRLTDLGRENFYAAVSANEWNHDLQSPAYQPIAELKERDLDRLRAAKFLKVAGLIGLGEWKEMEKQIADTFSLWVDMMGH